MNQPFNEKRIVVTGGAGALGSAITRHVIGQGGSVVVPVLDPEEITRGELASLNRVTLVHAGDLADETSADGFFAEHAGGIWASINVAGGFAYAPVEDADAELFEAQLRMNTVTCYNCCRAAIRQMRAGGVGGRIVNIAAKPALHPHEGANMAAYTASKAAVVALTGALAEEVKADGIWINAVVPSIMDTPSNREAMPDADHDAWPTVSEVAESACWLASPLNTVTRAALVPVYGKS